MAELDRNAIDGMAERLLASRMAPAVALAVTDPDRTLLARTYGLDVYDGGFGHAGDILGYVSYLRADTASGLGVVVFGKGFGGAQRAVLSGTPYYRSLDGSQAASTM